MKKLFILAVLLIGISIGAAQSALAATKAHSPSLVPAGLPAAISIPRINVRAPLEHISGRSPHDADAPYQWNDAAWFSRGARPGDLGHAVIFGHLDSTCCPAIFWYLNELHPGDVVQISYPSKHALTFRVMWSHSFWNAKIPTGWIFNHAKQRGLILWTCSGVWHGPTAGYDHKLLVYARMVMPGGRLG